MSQTSAQRILQMYMQDNTNRLNQALELAMNEAQQLQLSEQQTRQFLLKTLQEEQQGFNDYVAQLQKARTARARNDTLLAQEAMRQAGNNIANNERVAEYNRGVTAKAIKSADPLYNANSSVVDDFAGIVDKVGAAIADGNIDAAIVQLMMREDFSGKLSQAKFKVDDDKLKDLDGNRTRDYLMSDVTDRVLQGIATRAGVDISDPKVQLVKDFMFKQGVGGAGNKSGALQGMQQYTITERQQAAVDYVNDYELANFKGKKGTSAEKFGEITPQERKALIAAQPVLEALNAGDDTPFEITAEERRAIPSAAFLAYEQLKDIAREKPTVVTLDQNILLDDIALQRALRVAKKQEQVDAPMAKPRSLEVTMARAAEIAEPTRAKASKPDMSKAPAHEQKYYATERKALELSDQEDDYVRSMGTPETFGVTKWREVWNGEQMSSDYGTIVSEIEQQFPNPTDQLKALAAFNSRAMKLQRAKSPILVESGKLSEDYKAALEAMSPKE